MRKALWLGLLGLGTLSLLFAAFLWVNINADLSSVYFEGEARAQVDHVRFEVNALVGAIIIGAMACIAAFGMREKHGRDT